MKESRHLVKESSRASRAASVHAHIRGHKLLPVFVVPKKYQLGILSAKLHGCACIGIESLHCCRIGYDLLHKMNMQSIGYRTASGTAYCHAEMLIREQCLCFTKKLIYGLRLFRIVPLIYSVQYL